MWKILTMELVNINSIYFQIIVGEINVSSPISVDSFECDSKVYGDQNCSLKKAEEGGE